MEPYSADKAKRKKRKYDNHNPEEGLIIPFNLILRKDIYEGSEKIPFKRREHDFQAILREEFE
ncbi:unnamed protein product [marine sediment metagenome]|uniref:Uncharacterized protein n=1 Tax=marine sediment metagenome TaxID=412755 RepID=X1BKR0_9ZZZZ